MDKSDYFRRRQALMQRLMDIPNPKFFPRSVRKIQMLIANLDAEYSGETIEECCRRLQKEYKDKFSINNHRGNDK